MPEEKTITEGVADKKAQSKADAPLAQKPRAKKNKTVKHVATGRFHIQATYNNTVVTVTDLHGNVLAWSTSGHLGFRGPKKATPYAASMVIRDVAEKVKPMGMSEAHVFIKGVGQGRDGALRALHAQGISVLSLKDITPIPHNGPRACKPRRV
jgi:small subunit ribosomal protein S11